MTNHPNRNRWVSVSYGCRENPGVWDTGNGALRMVDECAAYPGIERVTVSSYCGRTYDDTRYYRLAGRPERTFKTLAEARSHNV
jgi:hypothetical protein